MTSQTDPHRENNGLTSCKIAELQQLLPNPGASFAAWPEGSWSFEYLLRGVADTLDRDRQAYRRSASGDWSQLDRECAKKLRILRDAHAIFQRGEPGEREISNKMHELERLRGHARLQPRGNVKRHFDEALFSLIDIYAENVGSRFANLSAGSKEAEPNGLVKFVSAALQLLGEHRSPATYWDRVNQAIRFARECDGVEGPPRRPNSTCVFHKNCDGSCLFELSENYHS